MHCELRGSHTPSSETYRHTMFKSFKMKTLLVFMLCCSACLSPSFQKGKHAAEKEKKTTVSIQDNMNPLAPFIF